MERTRRVPRDPFGLPVQRTSILLSALPPAIANRFGRATAWLALGDLTRYGMPTAQPGLYFVGFTHSLRGHLFEANLASRRLARNVARYLRA